jgi:hypothetical protein
MVPLQMAELAHRAMEVRLVPKEVAIRAALQTLQGYFQVMYLQKDIRQELLILLR